MVNSGRKRSSCSVISGMVRPSLPAMCPWHECLWATGPAASASKVGYTQDQASARECDGLLATDTAPNQFSLRQQAEARKKRATQKRQAGRSTQRLVKRTFLDPVIDKQQACWGQLPTSEAPGTGPTTFRSSGKTALPTRPLYMASSTGYSLMRATSCPLASVPGHPLLHQLLLLLLLLCRLSPCCLRTAGRPSN
jgi:hypothetical protein